MENKLMQLRKVREIQDPCSIGTHHTHLATKGNINVLWCAYDFLILEGMIHKLIL